jgi:RNA polymerase sigma-70 factor (ECF subfamily)
MPMSSGDTARLLRQAVAGDRNAVDDLLGRHRAPLKRMLAVRMDSRLRARIDPSDIVQTVLAEAAQKMVRFSQPPEQFFGWLRQLAWDELARLHRDHIRTRKRSVSLEAPGGGAGAADTSAALLADRLAARGLGPRSRMIHQERRDRVQQALAQLAPRDREVLELRFLEQLNISDAAAALGVSEAAVKSRQFRAIERLGELLGDLRPESEP